jgi:hypothetical protein
VGSFPAAVFFSEPNYRGFCASQFDYFGSKINLNNARQLSSPSSNNAAFGDNLASAVFFHTNLTNGGGNTSKVGEVVFYNATSCVMDPETPSGIEECRIDIFEQPTSWLLSEKCQKPFGKTFVINSIKINGPVGVVLIEGNQCQFFRKNEITGGNCISSTLDSNVRNADFFYAFPLDN